MTTKDIIFSSAGTAQSNYWIASLGYNIDASGVCLEVDSENNTYVVVNYSSQMAVVKYDSTGNILWQKYIGISAAAEIGTSIVIDSSNNIYVAGLVGTYSCLIKLNPSGTIEWQKSLLNCGITSVCVDASDNPIVAGSASTYAFVAKYNSSGTLQWQKRLSSIYGADAYSVTSDSSSNIYIAGTADYVDIDYNGTTNCMCVKLDSSGIIVWEKVIGINNISTGQKIATSLGVDSNGNVYFTGTYNYIYYGNTTGKLIVVKLNSSGTLQWQKAVTNSGSNGIYGSSISVDKKGNSYVFGYIVNQNTEPYSWTLLILKLNSSGVLQWERQFFAGSYPSSASNGSKSIYLGKKGSYYIVGNLVTSYLNTKVVATAKFPYNGTLTGSYGSYPYNYTTSSSIVSNAVMSVLPITISQSDSTLTEGTPTLNTSNSSFTNSVVTVQ